MFLGINFGNCSILNSIHDLSPLLDNLIFTIGSQTVAPVSSKRVSFSAGLFALPILLWITDIVTEVKNEKEAEEIFRLV